MIPRPSNPLVVALDLADLEAAERLAAELADAVGMLKVGLELFSAHGPEAVRRIGEHGPVFLDLKLHDIPTTVERASRACARLGVRVVTVHALGGEAMVAAAVRGAEEGAGEAGREPPLVAAVTVLSSVGEALAPPASLAFEAVRAGARAIVVSGADVAVVREALGEEVALVVPGIRPEGAEAHDQVRVLSPREALEAGADYLVIGRAITAAAEPVGVARSILAQVRRNRR